MRKKLIVKIILLILIVSNMLFSVDNIKNTIETRETKIDSLNNLLTKTNDDSTKAEIYVQLVYASLKKDSDREKAVEYYIEALNLFGNKIEPYRRAKLLNIIGYNNRQLGKFYETITYYEESLNIFKELEDKRWIIKVENNLALVYRDLLNYNEALELYQSALIMSEQNKDYRRMSLILNNIGVIYQKWGLYDDAYKYHKEALKNAEKTNFNFNLAYSYRNLGKCCEKNMEYEKALEFYNKSYEEYLNYGSGCSTISQSLKKIGDIYCKLFQYQQALTYYENSLKKAQKIDDLFNIASAEYSIGNVYLQLNEIDIASKYLVKSLDKALENDYYDLANDSQFLLSKVEEKRGNISKAFEYFKCASAMKDSIIYVNKIDKFNNLQIQYYLYKQTQKNELLQKNNKIQLLKIKREASVRNIFIICIIFLLIILVIIHYNNKTLEKMNNTLVKKNKEINEVNKDKEQLIISQNKEIAMRKNVENKLSEYRKNLEKLVEGTITDSKEKMENIIKSMDDIVFVLDSENRFISVNANDNERDLFRESKEFLGKKACDVLPEHLIDVFNNAVKKVKKHSTEQFEYSLEMPDGIRYYSMKLSPIFYKDKFNGSVAVARDITNTKIIKKELIHYKEHLEKTLNEKTEKLEIIQKKMIREEKLSVLGKIAGTVGHDLRNTLGVIANSAYFLNMKIKVKDEKIEKHIGFIEDAVEKSNIIISELLNSTKTNKYNLIEVDLNKLLRKSVKAIDIPENIELEMELDELNPKVKLDPNYMQRVFQNIISNAFNAMSKNGKLKIKTKLNEKFTEISFTDNGDGISKENLKNIFEPLFTTRAKGIGLGLFIVQDIINGHNGTIDVKSELGKGTTFVVKLKN